MNRLNFVKYLISAIILLMLSTTANAIPIVDTGSPLNDGNGYGLTSQQWLAGEFSINDTYTVTDISGFIMDTFGGSLTLAIYGDGGTVPDMGNEIFSQQFDVAATGLYAPNGNWNSGWYGVSGTSFDLTSGEYWVAFEVRLGDTYGGPGGAGAGMASSAPNPLLSYADYDGSPPYYTETGSILNFGVNIDATLSSTPVPEPSTLFLLSFGFIGLIAFGKRKRNSLSQSLLSNEMLLR